MEFHKLDLRWLLFWGFLFGLLFYLPYLGSAHLFDWDEINFAECAREMIVLKDYLHVHIDFEAFWEKPPLFIWMQVLSMKVFGIGEFAARFPNALLGALSIPMLIFFGQRYVSTKFGLIWSMFYAASLLPFLYFKSGIIDPWFNTFIFLSFIMAYEYTQYKSKYNILLLSGLFCGLAILTKGPAALLILGIAAVVLSVFKQKLIIPFQHFLVWLLIAATIPALWFFIDYLANGPFFFQSFIEYQIRLLTTEDAGHGGFPGYHFVVVLLGCFPAALFAIPIFFQKWSYKHLTTWMAILSLVTLLIFSLVQSKIIHYSSLTYLPLSFLAAHYLHNRSVFNLHKVLKVGFIVLTGIWLLLVLAIPLVSSQISQFLPEGASPNALAVMGLDVHWPLWYAGISIFLLFPLLFYFMKLPQMRLLLLSTVSYMVFMFLLTALYIPKIGDYTQNMAIEFYKDHEEDMDVYVENFGFKSYADLFYTSKKPGNKIPTSIELAIQEGLDKDLLIVTKIHREKKLNLLSDQLQLLYRKGEFAFYKRPAARTPNE